MTEGFESAVMECAEGWASFSSCSSGEIAHESSDFEQGVFTYFFCEALAGKAKNSEGNTTIEVLADYVKTNVSKWCDQQTQRQTPHFEASLSGSLVLATPPAETKPEPTPFESPFSTLVEGIDRHLSSTPEDVRRLTLTVEDEWFQMADIVHAQLLASLNDFSHPAVTASLGELRPFHKIGGNPWQELLNDISRHSLGSEFANEASAFSITFSSSEVVVPQTTLHVVTARFTFFYWLWYYHTCHQKQLQGKFTPKPQYTKGFFTFKPSAARKADRVEECTNEILNRFSAGFVQWAEQLAQYVESRIEPLRNVGPIVE